MQKSGLHDMKHHPGGSLKISMLFIGRCTIYLANLVPSSQYNVPFLALCNYIFWGVFDIFKYPRRQLITSSLGLFPIWRKKPWGRG